MERERSVGVGPVFAPMVAVVGTVVAVYFAWYAMPSTTAGNAARLVADAAIGLAGAGVGVALVRWGFRLLAVEANA